MKTTHCKSSQSLNRFDPVQRDTMKTIACLAAHTHIGQIREWPRPPPPPPHLLVSLFYDKKKTNQIMVERHENIITQL